MQSNVIVMSPDDLKQLVVEAIKEYFASMPKEEKTEQKKEFYNSKELCDLAQISQTTLWRMENDGFIVANRVGRKKLYEKEMVAGLIASGKLSKYTR